MAKVDIRPILDLPVSERLRVLEEIWESIAAEPNSIPLSDAIKEELDHRLDEMEADPDSGVPWEEVRKRYFKS